MNYRDFRYQVRLPFKVDAGGRVGYYIDTAIMALIAANGVAVILETIEPLYTAYGFAFYGFEAISVAIFSVEYLARVWCAVEQVDYNHPIWSRLRYAVSPYMLMNERLRVARGTTPPNLVS